MNKIVLIVLCVCGVLLIGVLLTPALWPSPAEMSLPDLPGTDTGNEGDLVEQSARENDDFMEVVPAN